MSFYRKNGFEFSWSGEGEGKPIVFLPGWAEIPDVWRFSESGKLKNYRKYFLDLGGHYPAEFPPHLSRLDADTFLSPHYEILKEIAGAGKITLIGHSTGGLVAYGFARRYPELVEKLIGVGLFLEGPLEGSGKIINFLKNFHLSIFIDIAFAFSQLSYSSFLDTVFGLPEESKEEVLNRPEIANFLVHFYDVYKKMEPKNLRLIAEFLDEYRMEKNFLPFPITVIHGQSDPVVRYQRMVEFSNEHKEVKLIGLKGIGHSPHVEDMPLFWEIIIDILKRQS